jgi:hypothetical protein
LIVEDSQCLCGVNTSVELICKDFGSKINMVGGGGGGFFSIRTGHLPDKLEDALSSG